MASVNYLGRIQQIEIRTQTTNKTTAQRWRETQIMM